MSEEKRDETTLARGIPSGSVLGAVVVIVTACVSAYTATQTIEEVRALAELLEKVGTLGVLVFMVILLMRRLDSASDKRVEEARRASDITMKGLDKIGEVVETLSVWGDASADTAEAVTDLSAEVAALRDEVKKIAEREEGLGK